MADRSNDETPQETVTTGAGNTDADLMAQLEVARAEAASFKDKYLREYADKDNFRKAQERRTTERLRHEKRDLLHRVLDVMDNLDRALNYQDALDRDGLQQSLRMVHWQLNELLKQEGLTQVTAVGETFDPRVHEAVEMVASGSHPEGVVVEEVRKGYKLGEETLRPALTRTRAAP
jgi:molecular chaperone GrpE